MYYFDWQEYTFHHNCFEGTFTHSVGHDGEDMQLIFFNFLFECQPFVLIHRHERKKK